MQERLLPFFIGVILGFLVLGGFALLIYETDQLFPKILGASALSFAACILVSFIAIAFGMEIF